MEGIKQYKSKVKAETSGEPIEESLNTVVETLRRLSDSESGLTKEQVSQVKDSLESISSLHRDYRLMRGAEILLQILSVLAVALAGASVAMGNPLIAVSVLVKGAPGALISILMGEWAKDVKEKINQRIHG